MKTSLLSSFIFLSLLIFAASENKIFKVSPKSEDATTSENRFYLTLYNENVFTYPVPTLSNDKNDTTVRTSFQKIRYDPWTLMVHTGDFTYSTSEGYVSHNDTKNVPFGSTFGCSGSRMADGYGKIDLRGTPYAVDTTFTHGGHLSAGKVTVRENGQVVIIRAGGSCGYMAPIKCGNNEACSHTGGWYLQLKLLNVNPFYVDEEGNSWLEFSKITTSVYKLPPNKPWNSNDSDLIRNWSRLRIDPNTLAIYTNDYSQSTHVGKVSHDNGFIYVAFGTARGCSGKVDGQAIINLYGTPVKFTRNAEKLWSAGGYLAKGSVEISEDRKTAVINGGGYCGWYSLPGGYQGGEVKGLFEFDK